MRRREALLDPLTAVLAAARDSIKTCNICGNIDTQDPCAICADPRRDGSVICVVEDVGDLWALERAKALNGRYHVLGGTLSALDGIGPEELNLAGLHARCEADEVREVILATNATVEGRQPRIIFPTCWHPVTHHHAVGPWRAGRGELDYLDDGTLIAAMPAPRDIG